MNFMVVLLAGYIFIHTIFKRRILLYTFYNNKAKLTLGDYQVLVVLFGPPVPKLFL